MIFLSSITSWFSTEIDAFCFDELPSELQVRTLSLSFFVDICWMMRISTSSQLLAKVTKQTITFLIDKGCNINQKLRNGLTPIHYAIKRGRSDLFRFLMEKRAQLDMSHMLYAYRGNLPEYAH